MVCMVTPVVDPSIHRIHTLQSIKKKPDRWNPLLLLRQLLSRPHQDSKHPSFPIPTMLTIRLLLGVTHITPIPCTITLGTQRTDTCSRIHPRRLLCTAPMLWCNPLYPRTRRLHRPNPLAPIRLSNL